MCYNNENKYRKNGSQNLFESYDGSFTEYSTPSPKTSIFQQDSEELFFNNSQRSNMKIQKSESIQNEKESQSIKDRLNTNSGYNIFNPRQFNYHQNLKNQPEKTTLKDIDYFNFKRQDYYHEKNSKLSHTNYLQQLKSKISQKNTYNNNPITKSVGFYENLLMYIYLNLPHIFNKVFFMLFSDEIIDSIIRLEINSISEEFLLSQSNNQEKLGYNNKKKLFPNIIFIIMNMLSYIVLRIVLIRFSGGIDQFIPVIELNQFFLQQLIINIVLILLYDQTIEYTKLQIQTLVTFEVLFFCNIIKMIDVIDWSIQQYGREQIQCQVVFKLFQYISYIQIFMNIFQIYQNYFRINLIKTSYFGIIIAISILVNLIVNFRLLNQLYVN